MELMRPQILSMFRVLSDGRSIEQKAHASPTITVASRPRWNPAAPRRRCSQRPIWPLHAPSTVLNSSPASESAMPSCTNCIGTLPRAGSTNCGRNTMKNSSAFGLTRLLSQAMRTTRAKPARIGLRVQAAHRRARSACHASHSR